MLRTPTREERKQSKLLQEYQPNPMFPEKETKKNLYQTDNKIKLKKKLKSATLNKINQHKKKLSV